MASTQKRNMIKERMYATWKFELRKLYLCEKQERLLKKISKYRNIRISKSPITAVLNGEDELVLLLTGSKKSWMYQFLFFHYIKDEVFH